MFEAINTGDSMFQRGTPMFSTMKPVEPGSTTPHYSKTWLNLHVNDVARFISSRYVHHDQFIEFARHDPCLAHEIINDFLLPNSLKISIVKEFLTSGSKIVIIEGDRGQGKTTSAHSFAEWFMEAGRQPYWVGAPQDLPNEFNRVSDPFDVPRGAVAFTDEIGVRYNARNSKDNVDDLQSLLTLRHTDRSSMYATQLSSLTDINFVRTADALVFKPLSLFGRQLERDVVGGAVPDEFMPKSREYTHFLCGKFRTTFRQPLGELWKEEYSTPFSMITDETVDIFVGLLIEDGFDSKGITRELKARSYRIEVKEVEKMVMEVNNAR